MLTILQEKLRLGQHPECEGDDLYVQERFRKMDKRQVSVPHSVVYF